MQTSESIGSIAAALAKAQGEFKNPEKNKEVEVQPKKRDDGSWPPTYKFKYATFDAILDMARPILARHEIAIVQTAGNVSGNVAVTTRFIHSSGEWVEDTIGSPVEGRGLQALGGAITYLKRYALTAMLGIAADEDDDANAADGNLADVRDRNKGGGHNVSKEAKKEAAVENPGDDWKAWISDLKEQVSTAPDYTGGKSIWNANAKPLKALQTAFPKTFDSLSQWVKDECEAKPKAA